MSRRKEKRKYGEKRSRREGEIGEQGDEFLADERKGDFGRAGGEERGIGGGKGRRGGNEGGNGRKGGIVKEGGNLSEGTFEIGRTIQGAD